MHLKKKKKTRLRMPMGTKKRLTFYEDHTIFAIFVETRT